MRTMHVLFNLLMFPILAGCAGGSLPVQAAGDGDPLKLSTSLVQRLYLSPLGLTNALVRVETENYLIDRRPLAFQVHVFDTDDSQGPKELLSVGIVMVEGRVQFVGASGDLVTRERATTIDLKALQTRKAGALQVIGDVTGWVEPSAPRPGRKPDSEEIVFRDPYPSPYVIGERRVVVLDSKSGLPLLVGSPSLPAPGTR